MTYRICILTLRIAGILCLSIPWIFRKMVPTLYVLPAWTTLRSWILNSLWNPESQSVNGSRDISMTFLQPPPHTNNNIVWTQKAMYACVRECVLGNSKAHCGISIMRALWDSSDPSWEKENSNEATTSVWKAGKVDQQKQHLNVRVFINFNIVRSIVEFLREKDLQTTIRLMINFPLWCPQVQVR